MPERSAIFDARDRVPLYELEQEQAPHADEPGVFEKPEAELKDQEQAGQAHQQRSGQHEGVIENGRVPGSLGKHVNLIGRVGAQLGDEDRQKPATKQDKPGNVAEPEQQE